MSDSAHRRLRAFGVLVAVVLTAHLLLLFGVAPSWFDLDDDRLPVPPVLSVRSVVLVPPVTAPAAPAPDAPNAPNAPVAAAPVRLPPRSVAASASKPLADMRAPSPTAAAEASPAPAVAPPVAMAAVTSEVLPAGRAIELPVYPTRLPAAGQWRYELRRGVAAGEALLRWAPDAQQQYQLQLEGRIAGVTVLDWVSRGAIDGAGLAPERFVIRRRGRDQQAANFQRDAGKITFSGPTHELPLWPGVQDRLSWMLQVAAVVQAAPERFTRGSTLALMVVGARGGADLWRFDVVGLESQAAGAPLKLVRQPRRPYDVQVEVWLDPARSYLPSRALLTQPDGGTPLELRYAPEPGAPPSTGP
jgi:hypothetical protein